MPLLKLRVITIKVALLTETLSHHQIQKLSQLPAESSMDLSFSSGTHVAGLQFSAITIQVFNNREKNFSQHCQAMLTPQS